MKFRFVVIDDAIFVREILKNITEKCGGQCIGEAENGREAIELVKKTLPDLAFLDLVMPLRNGLEIVDELQIIWPDLKIVVCSTLDQPEIIEKLKSKGIKTFFGKPFSKEEIEKYLVQEFLLEREIKNV